MPIAFAAGCFHFAYSEGKQEHHAPAVYADLLRKTLGLLPAISDISITYGVAFSSSGPIPKELVKIEDGGFFPHLHRLELAFTLFIPNRVQEELFPGEPRAIQATTENFRVLLRHEFYGPVAFVQCIDAANDCSPTDAVRLIKGRPQI